MAALLILVLVCAILLTITGSLPPWSFGLISLASLCGLVLHSWYRHIGRLQLKKRHHQLKACWGVMVRHLGGLQLPLETPGNLFLLENELRLETEHESFAIEVNNIQKILLSTADQIRRIPDSQFFSIMETGNSRLLSGLRDKIRHHDSFFIKHGILLLVYLTPDNELNLLILATNRRPQVLASLLRHHTLAGKINKLQNN